MPKITKLAVSTFCLKLCRKNRGLFFPDTVYMVPWKFSNVHQTVSLWLNVYARSCIILGLLSVGALVAQLRVWVLHAAIRRMPKLRTKLVVATVWQLGLVYRQWRRPISSLSGQDLVTSINQILQEKQKTFQLPRCWWLLDHIRTEFITTNENQCRVGTLQIYLHEIFVLRLTSF